MKEIYDLWDEINENLGDKEFINAIALALSYNEKKDLLSYFNRIYDLNYDNDIENLD